MASSNNIPILVLVCTLATFVGLFLVGVQLAIGYSEERRTHELYQNTNCLVTDHALINYTKTECALINSRCQSRKYIDDEHFVSYITSNGTVINSTVRSNDYFRKVGSHHQCFYNTENTTAVVWKVSDGKSLLNMIYICTGIAVAVIILGLSIAIGLSIIKMQKENSNNSPKYMPVLH